VVTIASINRDLDKYLNGRREKDGFRFFSRPKPKKQQPVLDEDVPQDLKTDEVHVFDKRPSFWDRLFGAKKEEVTEDLSEDEMARLEAMEVEIERVERIEEDHPEMTQEFEEVRESLLDRFFSLFRGYERQHRVAEKAEKMQYIEDEVIPRMDEDVKRVLKLVHKWLGQLPKRQKDAFKKSKDFIEYKALLEKYGVAKKKDAPPKGEPTAAPDLNAPDDDYPVLDVPEKKK